MKALTTIAATIILGTAIAAGTFHHRHEPVTLCNKDQLYRVTDFAQQGEIIRNDNFGTGHTCLTVRGREWSSFRVSSVSQSGTESLGVFPEIFYGCVYGKCSTGSRLPVRVRTAMKWSATWQTFATRPRGLWNKAFDDWFMKSPHVGGQAAGAELMIWLDTTFSRPSRPVTWIDGYRWWFATHRACNVTRGLCWNYVLFRKVVPVAGVRHLRLGPFIRYAEHLGLIKDHWWLANVEAGFEIWHGGRGLGTKQFAVAP